MPRVPIKPLITLTKAQVRAFAERAMTKSGGIAEGAQREFSQFKLPSSMTRKTTQGVLTTKHPEKGMSTTAGYPIEQARSMFRETPEAFTAGKGGPKGRRLRLSNPGETEGVIGPDIPRFGRRLVGEEVKTVPVDTARAQKDHLVSTSAAEITTDEAHAERLWAILTQPTESGGNYSSRTTGAKIWNNFWKSSKQAHKYSNSEDYFKSCFVRWKENPASLTKNAQGREKRLLNELWNAYGSDIPEGSVK